MTIVPAPYEPVAVDTLTNVVEREDGALETTSSVAANTTFTVTSDRPTWTYEELRRADAEYPAELVDRYGTAREGTPDRVHERTDNITSGHDSPYGKAVAIERWLETERNYSLEVPPPRDDVADQFIFDMDAGYCQYFATAMVEMLRTQGIPARYVTGYARGPTGEDGVERVTTARAHAWVEVYFEGVGWVKFDPTPSEREEVRANLEQQRSVKPPEQAPKYAVGQGNDEGDDWKQVDANVELLSDPVPGTNGTVRVTADGSPLEDHRVSFNGEVVGLTDKNGEVTGELPYAETLNVTVERYVGTGEPDEDDVENEEEETSNEESDSSGNGESTSPLADSGDENTIGTTDRTDETEVGGTVTSIPDVLVFTVDHAPDEEGSSASMESTRVFAAGASTAALGSSGFLQEDDGIPLATDVNVTVQGDEPLIPGETTLVTAAIRGEPVPNATVTVGDRTYTTNASGSVAVAVPYTETASVEVERGSANGRTEVGVATDVELTIGDEPQPGDVVTVEATVAGQPVSGLQVLRDGTAITDTNENGTATIPVPYAESLHVVASRGDVNATASADLPTEIDVETQGTPIPGSKLEILATLDGEPVPNATIRSDIGTLATNENGTAALAIPLMPRASLAFTVERGAATGQARIGLLRPWGAIGAIGLAFAVIVGRRFDFRSGGKRVAGDGRQFVQLVVAIPRQVVSAIVRAAVWGATTFARGGSGTVAHVRDVASRLVAAIRRLIAAVPKVGRRIVRGCMGSAKWIRDRLVTGARWLAVGPAVWIERVRGSTRRSDAGPAASGSSTHAASDGSTSDADGGAPGPREIVVRAWRQIVATIRPTPSMTPGEIADRAVDRGLPTRHVTRIRDAFRDLRYGRHEPTQEEADEISESEQSIRSTKEGEK
ncbi:transglutaminase domain-containing protein [Haloparvum sp. AD34]